MLTRTSVLAGLTWMIAACAVTTTLSDGGVPSGERIGNLITRGVPEVPERITRLLAPYQNVRSAGLYGWTKNGLLIGTRFGETSQVHRVDKPLGVREQLTFFDEPVRSVVVPPNGQDGFLYLRDTGGSEFYQVYWFDGATGRSDMLSDGRSRNSSMIWSNAGDRFAFSSTVRNGTNVDIYVQALTGEARLVLETDGGGWAVTDWSGDDRRLLLLQYLSINESHLYELQLATGELRELFDPGVQAAFGNAAYDGESTSVYFTSDLGAEFMRLHHLDLESGSLDVLTGDLTWDVEGFEVSPNGEFLAYLVNAEGLSTLEVWHLPERRLVALPELPSGVIRGVLFSHDSQQLGLTLNRATSPSDVYSIDLMTRGLTRWTNSEVGGLVTDAFVEPELIAYPTFDDVNGVPRQIPAFVFKPTGLGPHPVVISIHGGPESQYRPFFSTYNQSLVNELGVAVVAPNVRGSHGYGKSYVKLDNGVLREDSVKDIGALLDWIASQPDLDGERVMVIGGSYGGYMVLAAMVHYGDRLLAGVERVGISNFVTFLENTQSYRRDLRRAEYGDERIPEMRALLESISPLNHVDKMTRPLMVTQGFNDPRVPASESAQIVAALEDRDVPVWYIVALDEGHGFRKKSNRTYLSGATWLFMERYLLGTP